MSNVPNDIKPHRGGLHHENLFIVGPPRTCSNLMNSIMRYYFDGNYIAELSMDPKAPFVESTEGRAHIALSKIEAMHDPFVAKDVSAFWSEELVDALVPYMMSHVIVMIRDPMQQMLSMLERKLNDYYRPAGGAFWTINTALAECEGTDISEAVNETAAKVKDAWIRLDDAVELLRARGKKILVVDSSDLTTEPAVVVEQVCSQLGFTYDPACLSFENRKYRPPVDSAEDNGWSDHVKRSTTVDKKADRVVDAVPEACSRAVAEVSGIYQRLALSDPKVTQVQ